MHVARNNVPLIAGLSRVSVPGATPCTVDDLAQFIAVAGLASRRVT